MWRVAIILKSKCCAGVEIEMGIGWKYWYYNQWHSWCGYCILWSRLDTSTWISCVQCNETNDRWVVRWMDSFSIVLQIFGTFCLSGLDRTWTFEMKPSHSPKWISLSTCTLCTRWMDIRIEKYYNREYEYQSTNLLLVVGNHSSRCSVDRHSRKVAGKCIIYWTSWQCRCHKNGGRRHNWRIRHLPHSYNPVSTYIILS